MRRSCAPSVKKPTQKASNEATATNSDDYAWGTKDKCGTSRGRTYEKKYIFNVAWRNLDKSKKKRNNWTGQGTLEIQDSESLHAVLKDENGQYLGSTKTLKESELVEGYQTTIGYKEIEILDEVTNMQEYWENRKQNMENRNGHEHIPKKMKISFKSNPSPNMITCPMQENKKLNKTATQSKANANVEQLALTTSTDSDQNQLPHNLIVSPTLARHLRPHQREGVAFLHACLMGYQQPGYFGCILADDMGLGKTLQCLVLAHALLRSGPTGQRVLRRVLIVTPSSLCSNWNNEVHKWLKTERMYAFVVDGARNKLSAYTQQQHVPFVIVSYETLLANAEDFARLQFDLLICDEGHRLKNQSTKIYNTLRSLSIDRRLILTGTPVQNDLQEFFALADFVNPGIFGSSHAYRQHFEIPVQHSQNPNASEQVKQLGAERNEELYRLSGKFLLRRTSELNRAYLPKKREYICFLRPTELQRLILQKATDFYQQRKDTILQDMKALQIITILKKICDHPKLIANTKTPNILTRSLERLLPKRTESGASDSAKLALVHNFLLSTAKDRHEKCVLVSNYTKTLDLMQELCDLINIKYLRLDGSTPSAERKANVNKFNLPTSEDVDAALVFLLSAKAGGMGLNLIGAKRLILYDNDWNPATDAQAMSRIWRDGQKDNVYIYRLVTAGCIEEKIFQRQTAKMSLGGCVLQTGAVDNMKFSAEELADLFTLQQDFSTCLTHESLHCDCSGDGTNLSQVEATSQENKQINELMQWTHVQAPFDEVFLEEANLHNASENLIYVFTNQTELVV